jgi:predicted MPP superfamily phosphohydrolase
LKTRTRLVTFATLVVILVILNWFILNGLNQLFPYIWFKPVYTTAIIFSIVALFIAVLRMGTSGMDLFFKIASHFFVTLLSGQLVFALVRIIGELLNLILSLFNIHVITSYGISFTALVLFIIVSLLFIDGIIRGKYAYRVIKQDLYFDDLPRAFDGFKIVQISDVHSGSFNNAKAVQKGINLVKAQHADLFVFTGDSVNNKAEEIKPWIPYFNKIKAPYGQFSILGNHDYGDYMAWKSPLDKQQNLENLKKYHQEIGFKLLLDEHVYLEKDKQKIVLAGVENWGIGFGERGNLNAALKGTSTQDFKVLLSHDPSHFDAQVKNYPSKINLTLSGHTHGMQFGIELFSLKWSPVQLRYKHWAGLKEENNRYLYINRGFGFIGFSGRVGIWPEVTLITLRKKV